MFKVHQCGDEFGANYAVFKTEEGVTRRVAIFDRHADAEHYAGLMNLIAERNDALAKLESIDDVLFDLMES